MDDGKKMFIMHQFEEIFSHNEFCLLIYIGRVNIKDSLVHDTWFLLIRIKNFIKSDYLVKNHRDHRWTVDWIKAALINYLMCSFLHHHFKTSPLRHISLNQSRACQWMIFHPLLTTRHTHYGSLLKYGSFCWYYFFEFCS